MKKILAFLIFLAALGDGGSALAANCTLSGTVLNVDGTPCALCTIVLNPATSQPLTTGGTAYTSQPVSTTTDSNGVMTAVSLPQGLIVNVTISENGATFGGYTAIVPFMSSATFVQMNQGISTSSLNALASLQPPTGPLSMNSQNITNLACPANSFDALAFGCNASVGTLQLNGTEDFNNWSGINIGNLMLVKQPAPSSVTVTATCSGTCATTDTYNVTCVTDTGESGAGLNYTASNASALSGTNFNTISWASQPECTGGYNIYGRISGSLGFLANVPVGTLSYVDNGSVSGSTNYTFSFSSAASPSMVMWDLVGAATNSANPIDTFTTNTGNSTGPSTVALTTAANNETYIPIFALARVSGTFTNPAGFSNVLSVGAAPLGSFGIWGGTKNLASAGNAAAATGTTATAGAWSTMMIAVTPANTSTPITVPANGTLAKSSTGSSLTFTDPAGATAGDLEIICVAYKQGTGLTAPPTFSGIGSVSAGAGLTKVSCFANTAQGIAKPPTTNTTGILSQVTTGGVVYKEVLLGLEGWSANNNGHVNGASGSILGSITYPVPLTVTGCRANWANYAGCSPFPVWAIVDVTASNKVLCSSGTVSTTDTDKVITPTNYSIAANHEIGFLATTPGVSCTTGVASMSIMMHQ